MVGFRFDIGREAMDYRAPQITKKELLGPPPRADQAFGQEDAERSDSGGWQASGPNTGTGTWNFGALYNDQSSARAATSETSDDNIKVATPRTLSAYKPTSSLSKRVGQDITSGQPALKKTKQTMVVDLTSDAEDDDRDDDAMDMIPRGRTGTATGHSTALGISHATSQDSTPAPSAANTTFTHGLTPYAAHPRKPAETHRARPLIKPAKHNQLQQNDATPPQKHAIFTRKPSSTQSPSPAPSSASFGRLAGHPLSRPGSIATKQAKRTGPFLEEDSDEEELVVKDRTRSPSVQFISRKTFTTPVREQKRMQMQQSRLKRIAAHGPEQALRQDAEPVESSTRQSVRSEDARHMSREVIRLVTSDTASVTSDGAQQGNRNGSAQIYRSASSAARLSVPGAQQVGDDPHDTALVDSVKNGMAQEHSFLALPHQGKSGGE